MPQPTRRAWPRHVGALLGLLLFFSTTAAQAQLPVVLSLNPTAGTVGTPVDIIGTDFNVPPVTVSFDGVAAAMVTVSSDGTLITAVVPANATSGPVRVTNNNGPAASTPFFTVFRTPMIQSFTPTVGIEGTPVTINGTGFSGTRTVGFNGRPTPPVSVSETQVTARVPVGATSGPITITTPAGTGSSLPNQFLVARPPTIASFAPTRAPVGEAVTINGTNLLTVTEVRFGGTPAPQPLEIISDAMIRARVPGNARNGSVTVINPAGMASRPGFELARLPKINSFSPTSGPVLTDVILMGRNFATTTKVRFRAPTASGRLDADFEVLANDPVTGMARLRATVPQGAMTGNIRVVNDAGGVNSTDRFEVIVSAPPPPPPPAPPVISGFTPASGAPQSSVTVSGSGFTGATQVSFNGVAASFSVASASQLSAQVPSGATSGPIRVSTAAGTATSPTAFTVLAPPPPPASPPVVSFFTPASGSPGANVQVDGTNFVGVTQVRFNNTVATFQPSTANRLFATVPSGATSGPIRVSTAAGTGSSVASFTVTAPPPPPPAPPTVSGFQPISGQVGTSINISGTGFVGVTQVTFNGFAAQFFVQSPSLLVATVPAGATSGPIRVTTAAGTGSSVASFTVSSPPPPPPAPPTVSGFQPISGQVGSSVNISGTGFVGVTQVTFNGLAAQFFVQSPSLLVATVPAGATSGPIRVTTAAGTGASAAAFTVSSPPPPPPVGLSVTVTSPNGGETFDVGQTVNIQWTSSGATSHRIQVAVNGGAFNPIVTGLPATARSFAWTVPASIVPVGASSASAVIKVIARDETLGTTAEDTSNGSITLRASAPPPPPPVGLSVTVTSPNGGEVFDVGQTVNIQWTSSGATSHRIQVAINGGAFNPIVTGLPATARSFAWTVPASIVPVGATSASAVIKVIARDETLGTNAEDTSNGAITLQADAPPPPPPPTGLAVTVTAPNGGETFFVGQIVNIQWTSSGATSHRAQVSVNGGTFNPIVTGLPATARSFAWTVPSSILPFGQSSASVVIKVIARNESLGTTAEDTSNEPVTIQSF